MELAQTAAAKAQAATAEFDANVGAARADLYKQMDERRKVAEQYRTDVMAKTRQEVDASLADAKTKLDAQTAAAKTQLEKDADSLGKEIAQQDPRHVRRRPCWSRPFSRAARRLLSAQAAGRRRARRAGRGTRRPAPQPAADHAVPAAEHAAPAAEPGRRPRRTRRGRRRTRRQRSTAAPSSA